MSLLYSTNFKFSNDELKKYPDFMDSDTTHHNPQNDSGQNSGLARYYSAPTSLVASILDETEGTNLSNNGGGGGREDYRFIRSSSPEVETILSRFMASCNGPVDSGSQNLLGLGERPVKQETMDSVHRKIAFRDRSDGALIGNSSDGLDSSDFENSIRLQSGARNCSNLFRQHSSPAGFFSGLTHENGFDSMRDIEKFGIGNRQNGDAHPSSTRISNQMNFYGQPFGSRPMPSIAEEENKRSGHADDSWDDTAIRDSKRARDNNGCSFSTSIRIEVQNGNSGNGIHGLTHHLSLPNTFAPVEKFLTFQDPVPHQIRAKRGCATHPRSIAERMRRARISERMRKLQELFPDMDKQTSTADMLDLAVEYIKGLQRQVKTLTDTKARCRCLSK